jgi:DNA-directed RNA polymerase subunit RPC12/RpoP
MTDSRQLEIICSACGADTLVVRKPRYEGFTKVGEVFACASCGHEFAGEEDVPYKERREAAIFSDADRSEKVEVFHEDETGRSCR